MTNRTNTILVIYLCFLFVFNLVSSEQNKLFSKNQISESNESNGYQDAINIENEPVISNDNMASIQRRLSEIFANERPFVTKREFIYSREAISDVQSESQLTDLESLPEMKTMQSDKMQRTLRSYTGKVDGLSSSLQATDEDLNIDEDMYGYLNEWAVHLAGGLELATKVFQDLGYDLHGKVSIKRRAIVFYCSLTTILITTFII